MPISNIAKVFGPTIVGYSSVDPDQYAIYTETMIQASVSIYSLCVLYSIIIYNLLNILFYFFNRFQVMENLLSIPSNYWSKFSNVDNRNKMDNADTNNYGSSLKRQYSKNFGNFFF